jgi:hypothetical protein
MSDLMILGLLVLIVTKVVKLLLFRKSRKKSIICKLYKLLYMKINRKVDSALKHQQALDGPKVVPMNRRKRARG